VVDYRDAPRTDLPAAADDEADDVVELRTGSVAVGDHLQRLDKLLVGLAPEFSRTHLQGLIARGHVRVDGVAALTASRRLKSGQRLAVDLVPTEETLAYRPQAMDLAVLYEDDHLLVIDKPVGLVVHPAPGNWSGTLLNGLLARDPAASLLPRAGIVHRLDKDTSGVMVVGRTLAAVTALSRAIAERSVQRRYLAIVHGAVELAPFSIEAPIGRDPAARVRMAVVASGRPARTDVSCVAVQAGCSALQCALHTGRTHQIRVHLASRGHALVGDSVYGGRPALGLQRQALHAVRLALQHPVLGGSLAVDCPPPPDFAAAWAAVTQPPG
jgi:23S rRNA pseudouridine1911/1915/1917 synthase